MGEGDFLPHSGAMPPRCYGGCFSLLHAFTSSQPFLCPTSPCPQHLVRTEGLQAQCRWLTGGAMIVPARQGAMGLWLSQRSLSRAGDLLQRVTDIRGSVIITEKHLTAQGRTGLSLEVLYFTTPRAFPALRKGCLM